MSTIGQFVGFIYLGIFIASFQFKNKKKLMKLRIISKVLASIHYIMIGAIEGFVSQFVGIFPNYYAYKYENNMFKKDVAVVMFSLFFIIAGLLVYKNIYDILPIIGSIITVIALFKRGTKCVRTYQFIISPMFLIYNIVNLSYAGIITEVLILVSSLIGILRLDKRH